MFSQKFYFPQLGTEKSGIIYVQSSNVKLFSVDLHMGNNHNCFQLVNPIRPRNEIVRQRK